MKRKFKVMVNNSTNINKTNNHLSPTVHVFVVIHFCDGVWSFCMEVNLQVLLSFVYICFAIGDPVIKRGVGIPLKCYIMKRKFKVMVNNSTNINKTNNHLSPSLAEHKKKTDIRNPSYGLGHGVKMWRN
jgi:ribosomal protein L36